MSRPWFFDADCKDMVIVEVMTIANGLVLRVAAGVMISVAGSQSSSTSHILSIPI